MSNYVDNKKLSKELGEWAKKSREQIACGDKPNKMTDYIAECVFLICNNMSYKSSFINYSYKEDMIGDAIENCVKYIKNFDIEKNNNAFGYISTIAYYAFIRRIKKENKRHIDHLIYVRTTFSESDIRDALDADNPNDIKSYNTYVDYMQGILDDMNIELPDAPPRKKRVKKKTAIETILKGEKY